LEEGVRKLRLVVQGHRGKNESTRRNCVEEMKLKASRRRYEMEKINCHGLY